LGGEPEHLALVGESPHQRARRSRVQEPRGELVRVLGDEHGGRVRGGEQQRVPEAAPQVVEETQRIGHARARDVPRVGTAEVA